MSSPSSPAVAVVYVIDSSRHTGRVVAAHGVDRAMPDGAGTPPALVFDAVRSGRPHFGQGLAGFPDPMHAWLGSTAGTTYAVLPLATDNQAPDGALLLTAEPESAVLPAPQAAGEVLLG